MLGSSLLALPAAAQKDGGKGNPLPDPTRIGFGIQFTPFGGDHVGRLNLGRDLRRTTGSRPFVTGVYLDLSANGATGKHLDPPATPTSLIVQDKLGESAFMGAGITVRNYPGRPGSAVQPYAGAGFGVYALELIRYIGTRPPGGKAIDNSRRLGGKLFAGADFKGGFFAEADFVYPGLADARVFGLLAGYRF